MESLVTHGAAETYAARRLRSVLMAGFGGIAMVFLIGTIDAVRLLDTMRADDQILREKALARTNHLASIRSSILLTHTYLGDYFQDLNANPEDYLPKAEQTWSRMRSDLADYRSTTLEEEALVKSLEELLEQDWQHISRAMRSPAGRKPTAESFSATGVLPSKTLVIEITTQLESIDAKQEATTEAQIQGQFERLSGRLRTVLTLALAAALILAIGCLVYIFRIERQNRRRYDEILKGRKALEQLSARLVEAQETERRAISRELHDQIGQTLNALLVDAANLAKRIAPDDAVSQRYLDNIRSFAGSSVNSIRDIALLLRPSMLDDLGLIPALEWQAREVSRRTGIKVEVTAENVPDSLSDGVRTCIYRVAQEALQNVSRHSGAKSAVVSVHGESGSLFLSVADDGHGFDPERARGLGMLGMEERVRQLGGRFDIRSSPEKGATLRVTLPAAVAPTV